MNIFTFYVYSSYTDVLNNYYEKQITSNKPTIF